MERIGAGALEEMLNATPDGIIMAGHDGRIRYANRAAAVLFGYRPDELIGATVEQLVPGWIRGHHVAGLQGLRRDGSEVPVEISHAPMTGDGEQAVVTVIREASEQIRLEEEHTRYAQAHAVEEIVGALDAIVKIRIAIGHVEAKFKLGGNGRSCGPLASPASNQT